MRYSTEERQAHVELWRESGLSRAAYCRQSGLTYATFVQWVQRAGETRHERVDGADNEDAFIELSVARGRSRSRKGGLESVRAELLDTGVTVLIDGDTAPGRVAAVLEALARC